jgi:hypothetical protein
VYFLTILNMLWQFGIFCGHLEYFPVLVCLDKEKNGNPAWAAGFEPVDGGLPAPVAATGAKAVAVSSVDDPRGVGEGFERGLQGQRNLNGAFSGNWNGQHP